MDIPERTHNTLEKGENVSAQHLFDKYLANSTKMELKNRNCKDIHGISMGENSYKIPTDLYRVNRERVCEQLKSVALPSNSYIFLQGGSEIDLYDTDVKYVFRQEAYFNWAFGVMEPDCYGAIEVSTGNEILFCPRHPEDYLIWHGKPLSPSDYKEKYDLNEVYYNDEIDLVLQKKQANLLLTLGGKNSDSGLHSSSVHFEGSNKFTMNNDVLSPIMAECRMIKSDMELDLLRYVNQISSEAHCIVMRKIKPGLKEYQMESVFLNYVYYTGGCRHVSYTCICGTGHNASYLHYGHAGAPNNKVIEDGNMCLFDMGASYLGYASDITCSFPANGKFTEDQKIIYTAVYKANRAVIETAKPGVSWVDMHILANKVMLQHLLDCGLLRGNINDIMACNLGATFQPHGLGHLMGLDVHDVGGYLDDAPPRPKLAGLRNLRTARTLEQGMVITVEPGCYFIDKLLDEAFSDPELSKYLVPEAINRFRGFGGVRIEDDVVITDLGVEVLTVVPRSIEDIEAFMAEGHYAENSVKSMEA